MRALPIDCVSAASQPDLSEYLKQGSRRPVILTGAIEHWPARRKWSFDYFRANFGNDLGVIFLEFGKNFPNKVTNLAAFIEHLDTRIDDVPGFWTDADGNPSLTTPACNTDAAWSFTWDSFGLHPQLINDFFPFPASLANYFEVIPQDLQDLLRYVSGKDIYSIYVSRRNTVTPFHADFLHTFSCLSQCQGRKKVYLIDPDACPGLPVAGIDPENPDAAMARAPIHTGILEPGNLLIIPPNWWHYVKALDHSITLSCNIINAHNAREYFKDLIGQVHGIADIEKFLTGADPGPAQAP